MIASETTKGSCFCGKTKYEYTGEPFMKVSGVHVMPDLVGFFHQTRRCWQRLHSPSAGD